MVKKSSSKKATRNKAASASKKKSKKDDSAGVFIPAGVCLGLGLGFLLGNLVAWFFIGLGVGFVAMAIAANVKKKNS